MLNKIEDKVLRHAYSQEGDTNCSSFPEEDKELVLAAFESLTSAGYLEAIVKFSTGRTLKPIDGTVIRVLPKGVFYCKNVQ